MQDVPQKTTSSLADDLQPQSLDDLIGFADRIIQSRLCPDHFEDAIDVVLVAQQGAELGLNVMTSLQNSHVIHGQVGWDADLLKALCMRTGEVDQWSYEEKSAKRCAVTVQRTGYDPETFEWTMQKAEHVGLANKSVWQSHPDTMLRHRVDADAARSVFPDVVAGVHTPSELREAERKPTHEPDTVDATVVDSTEDTPQTVGQLDIALEDSSVEDQSDGPSKKTQSEPQPPDLTSRRRGLRQMLRPVDNAVADAFREKLKISGVWGDPGALADAKAWLGEIDAEDRTDRVVERYDMEPESDDDTSSVGELRELLDECGLDDGDVAEFYGVLEDEENVMNFVQIDDGVIASYCDSLRTLPPEERRERVMDMIDG